MGKKNDELSYFLSKTRILADLYNGCLYPQCTRGHTPRTVIFARFSSLSSIGVRSSTPHSSALKIGQISTVGVVESERDEFGHLQGT